jgi:hypothetical protein
MKKKEVTTIAELVEQFKPVIVCNEPCSPALIHPKFNCLTLYLGTIPFLDVVLKPTGFDFSVELYVKPKYLCFMDFYLGETCDAMDMVNEFVKNFVLIETNFLRLCTMFFFHDNLVFPKNIKTAMKYLQMRPGSHTGDSMDDPQCIVLSCDEPIPNSDQTIGSLFNANLERDFQIFNKTYNTNKEKK